MEGKKEGIEKTLSNIEVKERHKDKEKEGRKESRRGIFMFIMLYISLPDFKYIYSPKLGTIIVTILYTEKLKINEVEKTKFTHVVSCGAEVQSTKIDSSINKL